LVGIQGAAVLQGIMERGRGHQLSMGGQGGEGLIQPFTPLLKFGRLRKPPMEGLFQHSCGLQGKLPAAPGCLPTAGWTEGAELGKGDRIEGQDDLDQT
jgi:hypothetical protein